MVRVPGGRVLRPSLFPCVREGGLVWAGEGGGGVQGRCCGVNVPVEPLPTAAHETFRVLVPGAAAPDPARTRVPLWAGALPVGPRACAPAWLAPRAVPLLR